MLSSEERLELNRKRWEKFSEGSEKRGSIVLSLITPHKTFEGSRYLDIGCNIGGFVKEARKLGAIAYGIDIKERINWAAGCSVKDICGDEVLNLGKFDIITCNVVLEHVDYPDKAIKNISSLLKQDGVVLLTMPNPWTLNGIVNGHFTLFGKSLLQYEDALKYYQLTTCKTGYSVRNWLTWDYYTKEFIKNGFTYQLINTTKNMKVEKVDEEMKTLKKLTDEFEFELDKDLEKKIKEKCYNILETYEFMKGESEERKATVKLLFGINFWRVLLRKC